ncbi:conserved hypothetical protein [Paecilomyces variotii No. 5]|uniref:N-acetyltransferase domain-containing protein n=1 Tax=Byssochlamys spectabilis (strain No. 5 / NBRC 109023) TaxID=1356009 RepID=V5HWX3_BYSSN|nr:conserved hypothetical protein [Paecilomyces variotii No. 5]
MTSTRSEVSDEDNATLWARIKAARVRLSSETDFYRNYGFPAGSQSQANTEEHRDSSRDGEAQIQSDAIDQAAYGNHEVKDLGFPTITALDESSEKKDETHPADGEAELQPSGIDDKDPPADSEAEVVEVSITAVPDRTGDRQSETCSVHIEADIPTVSSTAFPGDTSENEPENCVADSERGFQNIPPITTPDDTNEKQPETCSGECECLPSPPAEVTKSPSSTQTVTLQDTLSVSGSNLIQSQLHEISSTQVSAARESTALRSLPSTKPEGLALELKPATRMADSDDSDVVMLRPRNQNSISRHQHQENIRPTGTEPGKHRKSHPQKFNKRNGERSALGGKSAEGPSKTPVEHISTARHTGQEWPASPPHSPYKTAPLEVQEELKRLQEEAMAKAIERRFEEVPDADPETLNKVRKGPAANPESGEFVKITAFRTINIPDHGPELSEGLSGRFHFPQELADSERKKLQWVFYSQDTPAYPTYDDDGQLAICSQPTPECEDRLALLASHNDGTSVGLRLPPQPPRDFPDEIWDGIAADWLFRPTFYTNLEVSRQLFWRWLDSTIEISCPVDIYHKAFFDGTAHTDGERGLFIPDIESHDAEIDMTDEETRLHYNETSTGYILNYKIHLRKEAEGNQARIRRERAVYLESCLNHEDPNPYVPKANIYLRPAENRDVSGLLELCNWYINNTALCADLETLTRAEMTQRIADCKNEKLPFIVAVERNNRHSFEHRERVLGYALATDYMGQTTAGRHTVELEVFVSPGSKRLGVARCLMDKLLQVCDPTYVPHLGYFFDSDMEDRPGYECGGRRMLARLIFTYCFPEDDESEYERVKGWLKREYNFHEQGLLKGVCVKFGKLHDVSYLVRDVANFTP